MCFVGEDSEALWYYAERRQRSECRDSTVKDVPQSKVVWLQLVLFCLQMCTCMKYMALCYDSKKSFG